MNSWYMLLIYVGAVLLALAFLAASVVFTMNAVVRQKPVGRRMALLIAAVVFAAAVLIFTSSHKTYYRFNDWLIKGGNIAEIMERYGEPELGAYTEGNPGRIGYYIYTDYGPVMPDHLRHYYFIIFDGQGTVTDIEDGVQPGG